MVCTGNICRSPAAEEVLRQALAVRGFDPATVHVDSAGTTDWHEGELAHVHSRSVGARRGYDLTHRSRPVTGDDLVDFTLLLVMDASHERWLHEESRRHGVDPTIRYLRSFDPACGPTTELADPYGQPTSAYERMYDDIEAAMPGLVDHLVTTLRR